MFVLALLLKRQKNDPCTHLAPHGDGLAMVVDLPPLLPLRAHEVDQGVQKNFDPGHHLVKKTVAIQPKKKAERISPRHYLKENTHNMSCD